MADARAKQLAARHKSRAPIKSTIVGGLKVVEGEIQAAIAKVHVFAKQLEAHHQK